MRFLIPTGLCLLLSLSPGRAQTEKGRVDTRQAQGHKVGRIDFAHLRDRPFKDSQLRAVMQTRKGKPFQRRFFRRDLDALENLYRGEGYLEFEFVDKELTLDKEEKLHVTLRIDSKERWLVADVALRVDSEVDTLSLREIAQVRPGRTFRYGEVLQDERALQGYFTSQGYAQARLHNAVELMPDKQVVLVTYHIHPGRRLYFGPVRVLAAGNKGQKLHTRPGWVRKYITFEDGQRYDPGELRRTRNRLLRTDLFRAVTLKTPAGQPQVVSTDSLQPVEIILQEKKYRHFQSKVLFNTQEELQLGATAYHSNWMGRGARLGVTGSLGRPMQEKTVFFTERDLFLSGVDLTLSVSHIQAWENRRVFADWDESLALSRLPAYDPLLADYLSRGDQDAAQARLASVWYAYEAVERRWQFTSAFNKQWGEYPQTLYQTRFAIDWTQARNRPLADELIAFRAPLPGKISGSDLPSAEITPDDAWLDALTDDARTLNFTLEWRRDTRNNPILPSRGTFVRTKGSYAIQLRGQNVQVLDSDVELRTYLPWGRRWVWAQSVRLVKVASLSTGGKLPQVYWKQFGGEGSVRGVKRHSIQATDGGRVGINFRQEGRLRAGSWGLVLFWDRAGVWRHTRDTSWAAMEDGYGIGLRYIRGIPFRLDLGWGKGWRLEKTILYLSIGQAF